MTKRKVAPHRDTLWLSTADAINLIFGIIIHVILTRVLISSDYGLFILLLDFFHVCVIIIDLGMPTLIGRDGERLGIHLNKVIRKIIKIQIVPFLIGIFLFSFIGVYLFGGWIDVAIILSISAGLLVLTYSYRSALRSLGEARIEAIIRIIDRGVVAFLMITWSSTILEFAIATLIGPICSFVIAYTIFKLKVSPQLSVPSEEIPEISEYDNYNLIKAGLPFLFASAALVINVRIEKLLLGFIAGPNDVAIYQIAWLGFIAGYGPILSLRAILLSWFGEVRDDLEKVIYRFKRAMYATIIVAILGALIAFLIYPFVYDILFPEYTDSVNLPFRILLISWILHTISSPSLSLIQTSTTPWKYTRILWYGITVSGVVCLCLIYSLSNAVIGATIGTVCGSTIVFILSIYNSRTMINKSEINV